MKANGQNAVVSLADWPPNAGLVERVWALETRQSVVELFNHYARCVDLKDAAGVAGVFTDDGELCGPRGTLVSERDCIQAVYRRLLGELRTSSHLIGGVQVQIVSEDRAVAHAAFQAWDSYLPDDEGKCKSDCFSFGQYEAIAVLEADGEWRFARFGVWFNGQLEVSVVPTGRGSEQLDLPWPPFSH